MDSKTHASGTVIVEKISPTYRIEEIIEDIGDSISELTDVYDEQIDATKDNIMHLVSGVIDGVTMNSDAIAANSTSISENRQKCDSEHQELEASIRQLGEGLHHTIVQNATNIGVNNSAIADNREAITEIVADMEENNDAVDAVEATIGSQGDMLASQGDALVTHATTIAAHAGAIEALERKPQAFIDVTQHGVKGDGITDDHAAIQRLFDQQFLDTKENKRTYILYFPGGTYKISQTLVVRPQYGFRVLGGGITCDVNRFQGNVSELVWDGPIGGTVVQNLSYGTVWDGLNINGRGRASIGYLIDRDNDVPPRIPPGKTYIPTISIRNCETGFQVGGELGDSNCDWISIAHLNTDMCKVGYRLRNHMGITHNIDFYHPYNTETLVYVNGGGNFNCNNLGVVWGCKKILYFGEPGGGSNTASFRFNNVKQDNHLNDVVWFSQNRNDAGSVLFENSHIANDHLAEGTFQVQGYVDLTLRRVWNLPVNAIDAKCIVAGGKEWSPNILVERCKCNGGVTDGSKLFRNVVGTCYLEARDIMHQNCRPVVGYKNFG